MANPSLGAALRHLRAAAEGHGLDDATDAVLIERFLATGEEAAFAALMRRHGPMVLAVCGRVLRHAQDAEDVFQATFLTLARSARSIRKRDSVGSWLHGVAHRLALTARARGARSQAHERRAAQMRMTESEASASRAGPGDALDEALGHLPEVYREALLLCHLEGRTHAEASRQLGCPLATLRSRLQRGRKLLRAELARRGVVLSTAGVVALLTAAAASAAVRAGLFQPTLRAAVAVAAGRALADTVSAPVAALVEGGSRALGWLTAKGGALLVALTLVATGAGLAAHRAMEPAPQADAASREAPAGGGPRGADKAHTDRHGDPLPPGALARLGTVRFQHGKSVFAADFTADGSTVVSGGFDGTVRFWDAATGRETRCLTGIGAADRLALSPDGKAVATAAWDGPVVLWDAATGKQRWRVADKVPLYSLAFSPDGKLLAWVMRDRTVLLRDARTGREVRRLDGPRADPRTLKALGITSQGGFQHGRFAREGSRLAAHATDGTVAVWEVATGRLLRRFGGPGEEPPAEGIAADQDAAAVRVAAFSADLTTAVVGGGRRPLRVIDLSTGKTVHSFPAPSAALSALALSPDGKTLAVATIPVGLHLLDVATGKQLWATRQLGPAVVMTIAFSPDGRRLAVAGGGNFVHLLDARTGKESPSRPAAHREAVRGVAFSADGKTLATVSRDETVRLWRAATGEPLRHFRNDDARDLSGCAFSPTAAILATWENRPVPAYPGGLSLWDADRGKELRRIALEKGHVREAAFTPDGKTLAAACTDNRARLWEVSTGRLLREFEHDSAVHAGALSPDGKVLATIDSHVRIRLWDVALGKPVRVFKANTETYRICGFTPDGKTLVTDGPARRVWAIWEVATGALRQRLETPGKGFHGVALSPNGKVLASVGFDGVIRLLAVPGGKELHRLQGHGTGVTALAFSPDGRRLASASWDTTALVWDVETVCPRRQLRGR
jgi:RNA polymerase sigma factor (sigma-70 family)